jgi:CheY-like chemotaxis protein
MPSERVRVTSVGTAGDALAAVREEGRAPFDLVIMGLELPDKRGFDLIDELAEESSLHEVPVIIYSANELSKKEETHLKRLGQSMVLKDVRSPERLVDEVALFLHRRFDELPPERQQTLRSSTTRRRAGRASGC